MKASTPPASGHKAKRPAKRPARAKAKAKNQGNSSPKRAKRGAKAEPEQWEWEFPEAAKSASSPRCDHGEANADLHLVAYEAPGKTDLTVRLFCSDCRHLHRKETKLSVPIFILNLATLKQLESKRKIPRGTRAASELREWLRLGADADWEHAARRRGIRQAPLDLETEEGGTRGLGL